MKRLFGIFLTVAILASGCIEQPEAPEPGNDPVEQESDPAEDDPTPVEDEPAPAEQDSTTTVVKTAAEFIAYVRDYNAGVYDGVEADVRLASDINFTAADLSDWNDLGGIGNAAHPFRGTFDGGGFSFRGITGPNPIFGALDSLSTVSNVVIDSSCFFTGVAALAAEAGCTFSDCINYAGLQHNCTAADGCVVGGLVATLLHGGRMTSCTNAGDVTLVLTSPCKGVKLAGVAAMSGGGITLEKCTNTGYVHLDATALSGEVSGQRESNSDIMMGGILACSTGTAVIRDAQNSGFVYADIQTSTKVNQRPSVVGGIAGYVSGALSEIAGCISTGSVHNRNYNNSENFGGAVSGGIAGAVLGTDGGRAVIRGCTVSGPDLMQTQRGIQGGIVGYASGCDISACRFSKSTVSCSSNIPHFNGGICGKAFGSCISGCTVEDTFQACKVSAATSIGGVCGWMDGSSKVLDNELTGVKLARNGTADFNFGAVVGTVEAETAEISGNKVSGFWSTDSGTTYTPFTDADLCHSASFVVNAPNTLVAGSFKFAGTVTCGSEPLSGVVVTDGLQSVQTDAQGRFSLESPANNVRFISVCVPEGYEAPAVDGLPKFFVKVNAASNTGITFNLNRMANPDKYSVVFTADPQPRPSSARYDCFAYHALDCCKDLYRYVGQRAATITDRRVYGMVLGDVVHENMSLYSNHVANLKSYCSSMSTYHVMGNHDYNPSASDMRNGTDDFCKYFGPVDYSMNIGKFHIIVVDDIQSRLNASGELKDYSLGLNEDQLKWLESDLKYVPESTPVILCAHSPLFARQNSGNKSVSYTESGADGGAAYTSLLSKYKKVYMFGGHMHHNFTFIYSKERSSDTAKKNIEAIQLARSTGALWINEYINTDGTPRGFLQVDVDGTSISWQFKPIPYQTGAFVGKYSSDFKYSVPSYPFRDWNYVSGTAMIDGKSLDEAYQMKLYPSVDIGGTTYMLANVFMYDVLWQNPVVNYKDSGGNGKTVTMQRYTLAEGGFDPAYRDLKQYYCDNNSYWLESSGTGLSYNAHMFRCPMPADCPSKTATVSVTDRFGNKYSSEIKW